MFKVQNIGCVNSTNDIARDYIPGTVIVAEEQKRGRGRFERKWDSGKGGLWFSIVVEPIRRLFEYMFIAALSVSDAIGVENKIKWPNDVFVNGKKVCGILSECFSEGEKIEKIIVGMGINVNNDINEDISDIAISLKEVCGEVDKEKLLESILKNFEKLYSMEFSQVLLKYKERCLLIGSEVEVKGLRGVERGKCVDISDAGEIVLETKDGIKKFNEGDVSVV